MLRSKSEKERLLEAKEKVDTHIHTTDPLTSACCWTSGQISPRLWRCIISFIFYLRFLSFMCLCGRQQAWNKIVNTFKSTSFWRDHNSNKSTRSVHQEVRAHGSDADGCCWTGNADESMCATISFFFATVIPKCDRWRDKTVNWKSRAMTGNLTDKIQSMDVSCLYLVLIHSMVQ